MNPTFLLQVFLPTLVPLTAGWALRRFTNLQVAPLQTAARWLFLPALIFLGLLGPMTPRAVGLAAGAGAALALAAWGAVYAARRWSRLEPSDDVMPNVAAFALPFLVLSWDADGAAVRAGAWMFVGVALTALALRGPSGLRQLGREPWLYAAGAAVALALFEVPTKLPRQALGALVQAAYPVLLFYLGTLLHPIGAMCERRTLVTLACRFASGLAIIALLHFLVPLPRSAFEAAVVVALAPPAACGAALMGEGRGEADGVGATFLGTLASLVLMLGLVVVDW